LRGRVGRGAEKSYCILMTGDGISKEAQKRMDTMVSSNDGFVLAEVDLQLRGPGDLMGTQQSGALALKIADLARDGQIVQLARENARSILDEDPTLILEKNRHLNLALREVLKNRPNWGRISWVNPKNKRFLAQKKGGQIGRLFYVLNVLIVHLP